MRERLERFIRETLGETKFIYDPSFTENTVGPNKISTPWRNNPDGSITVGKAQVMSAIESAKNFRKQGLGKKEAEQTRNVIGLSVEYMRQHFPQALKEAGYDE